MALAVWYQLSAAVLILFLNRTVAQASCDGKVKIDCLPGNDSPTENDCKSRGCCWQEAVYFIEAASHGKSPVPCLTTTNFQEVTEEPKLKCTYPSGYSVYTVSSLHPHESGVDAELSRRGPPSGFPKDVQNLALNVQYIGRDALRVKITDAAEKRWEPPLPELDIQRLNWPGDRKYTFKVQPDKGSFQIIRKDTKEIIFDTGVGGLIFSDQFIQLSTLLPTTNIYGIGEHHDDLNRGQKYRTFTLFNRGEPVPQERTGFNLYGSHPFYLGLEKSGNAYGVFLHNSNAMDIVVQPENPSLTFRTIGGVLDFFFFLGPTGDDVVKQYNQLLGRPLLIPYWSLGFHLSRYGYNTTELTRQTWINNRDAGIPVDTMWSDIDYMDKRKDFTLAPGRMDKLKEFVVELQSKGVKYIMNNSPGLTGMEAPGAYPPVDEAKKLDILIKDYKGDLLEALVWQNITYMLDFSNPLIKDYWEKNFRQFREQAPFSAAWIDMNEPYSFHLGSLNGCPDGNLLDYPPYVPGKQVLYNGTICLSAQHHLSTHYNLHNLYAMMETVAMNRALRNILPDERPFVLSRASSPGLGVYGVHWSGDVHSSWEQLQYSVINMINFNMYGIPMVGTDICGFVGDATEELCIRWMQLGAFYPFSRNHNDFDTIPQDPAAWRNSTVKLMKEVVEDRYRLLPYFYSLMVHSHVEYAPAVRPLFFDFPKDPETYRIERQFLWGESLMVLPVLTPNTREITAYLPSAVWYDYYTGQKYDSKGQNVTFQVPLEKINVLVKEGSVITLQDSAQTTKESRAKPFHLLLTLRKDGSARGHLYWDDGESPDNVLLEKFNYIFFWVDQGNLSTKADIKGFSGPMQLKSVTVYGLEQDVKTVTVNGITTTHTFKDKVLQIDCPEISLLNENKVSWR